MTGRLLAVLEIIDAPMHRDSLFTDSRIHSELVFSPTYDKCVQNLDAQTHVRTDLHCTVTDQLKV